jgi:threonine aldolase
VLVVGASEDVVRARIEQLRAGCSRLVNGHGNRPPSELLAQIPADTRADRHGKGGVVEQLEGEVADLLGRSAAVFLPTGTVASSCP